ncbi:MAG TPA: CBS domain-containing protein [Desulfobacteraceae bacterium]|nr:CBS domain-containing protein [Desulfobacteraceae bacterium]
MNQKDTAEEKAPLEIITTHINADFDALASMIAAGKIYPDAVKVFPGSKEKNLRNFFLHSAGYLFNFPKLKHLNLDGVRRLILVDTRQKGRIGKFAELVDREDVEIHIYDHHPDSDEDVHGSVEVIEKVGSTTALLSRILREKGIPLSADEATILCLGIHEDTGSFTFLSTTPEDYRAAAWLTEQGADHSVVADMLTREMSTEQVWLLNDLTKAATSKIINGVKIVFTRVIREEYIGDFSVLVHKLMEMENLNVLFALAQMEDRIHIVARSRIDEVNVAEIAEKMGGGGHPHAASATVKNKTLAQVERNLYTMLRAHIPPKRTARDMMVSPAIHVSPDDSLNRAANLLTRYNINVLLVIDENSTLLGYITRQIVEKAVYFKLENLKVREYMNIEIVTVDPDAPLTHVQDLIIRHKARIIAVIEAGTVIGVITRTDILQILVGERPAEFLFDSGPDIPRMRTKHMAALLRERLPPGYVTLLKRFGQVGDTLGLNVYLVGGVVRDVLLNQQNLDVDIVVEDGGIKVAQEMARNFGGRVRSHPKFGTAKVIFDDGLKVDVATARMEYYESPGALPVVETSSLKRDLSRRDFTINTLAIKLNKKDYGTLIDYFGGLGDVKGKVLRVLHNLSFVEDPTRLFRAIRFEQRFGFKIGKLTLALMRNAVKINVLSGVSGHRLFLELMLILKEKDPVKAVRRMAEFNLLEFIHPRISMNTDMEHLLEEIRKVISWYSLLFLDETIEPWKVYFYALTSRLNLPEFYQTSDHMGIREGAGVRLIDQRGNFENLLERLFKFNNNNYDLYTLLRPYDTEPLLYLMAKANSEKVRKLISTYLTKLKPMKVQLTGKDLINMGFKPGPAFKQIFDAILEERMNAALTTKEEEIRLVEQRFAKPDTGKG